MMKRAVEVPKRDRRRCLSALACLSLAALLVVLPRGSAAAQSAAGPVKSALALQAGGEWATSVWSAQTAGSWTVSGESVLRLSLRLDGGGWRLDVQPVAALTATSLRGVPGSGTDRALAVELEKACLKIFAPLADLSLGRQEISWGVGHAWSPTDVFNPRSALFLGEPPHGVDAAVVRVPTGRLAYLNLVAALDRSGSGSAGGDARMWQVGARYHGNTRGTDWSLAGLIDNSETMIGADVKGDLGIGDTAIGWHAEAALHDPRGDSRPWLEAVVGADHSWNGGTVVLLGEYFLDSRGAASRDAYDRSVLLGDGGGHLARHYALAQLAYRRDELTSVLASVLANLVDRSTVVTAGATVSLGDGWTLSLSASAPAGVPGDEFAPGVVPGPGGASGTATPGTTLKAAVTYSF